MTGRVTFVGAGPGAADLITLRGYRALQQAEVVLYDNLAAKELVEGLRAELIYVGKRCGKHAVPQDQINMLLAAHARKGKQVVRLKGGDPSVLGRIGEECLHLAEQGIAYEVVPGVSSAIAGPMFAGIPVTHRGIADSFLVLTAHRRTEEFEFSIPRYNERTTLVLLMPMATVHEWQAQLLKMEYPANLPVAFVMHAGTDKHRVIVTTLDRIGDTVGPMTLESPTLAIVGHVVKLSSALEWFIPELHAPKDDVLSQFPHEEILVEKLSVN